MKRFALLGQSEMPHRATYTLGEQHLGRFLKTLTKSSPSLRQPEELGELVVVDFKGIESATGSYLKATVVRLLQLGAASVNARAEQDPDTWLNVYPLVANLNAELSDELDQVLAIQEVPCLEVVKAGDDGVIAAKLRGPLDRALRETLRAVEELRSATATALSERFAADAKIATTAWNNRLSDLCVRRLVRRRRVGRQWVYEPVARQVQLG
jgi:hypothetical protein